MCALTAATAQMYTYDVHRCNELHLPCPEMKQQVKQTSTFAPSLHSTTTSLLHITVPNEQMQKHTTLSDQFLMDVGNCFPDENLSAGGRPIPGTTPVYVSHEEVFHFLLMLEPLEIAYDYVK